ncbi:MAG: hypothetical protein ACFCAD_09640 [Pleurocapsa sp.]
MITIVRHKRTGNEYILLSINGEENKTNPSRFINELFNSSQAKSEVSCSATVCDVQGNLFLAYIDDLVVVEIEGKKPADILPEPSYAEPANEFYQSQSRKIEDDEELEDEELEDEDRESDRVTIASPESSSYPQEKPLNDALEDDDEDWI